MSSTGSDEEAAAICAANELKLTQLKERRAISNKKYRMKIKQELEKEGKQNKGLGKKKMVWGEETGLSAVELDIGFLTEKMKDLTVQVSAITERIGTIEERLGLGAEIRAKQQKEDAELLDLFDEYAPGFRYVDGGGK